MCVRRRTAELRLLALLGAFCMTSLAAGDASLTIVKCDNAGGNSDRGSNITSATQVCKGCSYSGGTCSLQAGVSGTFQATCFSSASDSSNAVNSAGGTLLPVSRCMCLNDAVTAVTSQINRLMGSYRDALTNVKSLVQDIDAVSAACANVSSPSATSEASARAAMACADALEDMSHAFGDKWVLPPLADKLGGAVADLLAINTSIVNSPVVTFAYAQAARAVMAAQRAIVSAVAHPLADMIDDMPASGAPPNYNQIKYALREMVRNLTRATANVTGATNFAATVAMSVANCTCPTDPMTCSSKTCFICPSPPAPPEAPAWPPQPPSPPQAPPMNESAAPFAVDGGLRLTGANITNATLSAQQIWLLRKALVAVSGGLSGLGATCSRDRPLRNRPGESNNNGNENNNNNNGHHNSTNGNDDGNGPASDFGPGQGNNGTQGGDGRNGTAMANGGGGGGPGNGGQQGAGGGDGGSGTGASSTRARKLLQSTSGTTAVYFYTVTGVPNTGVATTIASNLQSAAQLQAQLNTLMPGVTVTVIPGATAIVDTSTGTVIVVDGDNGGSNTALIVGLAVGLGVPLLILLVVVIVLVVRKQKKVEPNGAVAIGVPAGEAAPPIKA